MKLRAAWSAWQTKAAGALLVVAAIVEILTGVFDLREHLGLDGDDNKQDDKQWEELRGDHINPRNCPEPFRDRGEVKIDAVAPAGRTLRVRFQCARQVRRGMGAHDIPGVAVRAVRAQLCQRLDRS